MSGPISRPHLFEAARTRAAWSIQQLWVGYLALGGRSDAFDVEAFLHGLGPLDDAEQDVLANAVNERLEDVYLAARVPYLARLPMLPPCSCEDPLKVLEDLLTAFPPEDEDQTDD